MSRHHPDLVMCRKQAGIAIGRLCDKCDGKCPVCDSYVRPTTLVRICDECSFGNYQNKCVVCGGEGISDAFYCFECTRLEKDRDGCPKIINLGSSRTDVSTCPPGNFPKDHRADFSVCLYSYFIKRKQIARSHEVHSSFLGIFSGVRGVPDHVWVTLRSELCIFDNTSQLEGREIMKAHVKPGARAIRGGATHDAR